MSKILSKEEWLRRRRIRRTIGKTIMVIILVIILICFTLLATKYIVNHFVSNNKGMETIDVPLSNGVEIKTEYLTPNSFSRPQKRLKRINGVVVHYTANPGSTAENNRDYFDGLAKTKTTYASSHYVIGLEGEIIQCIPLTEISYASNNRNGDTISIECCHADKTGSFNQDTYNSLISLVAALCVEFDLDQKDIIRHYDVTGKLCPLYYVEHEDAWRTFKKDVKKEITKYKDALE